MGGDEALNSKLVDCVCVCVCVCVRERGKEKVKNEGGGPTGRASNGGWCTREVIA